MPRVSERHASAMAPVAVGVRRLARGNETLHPKQTLWDGGKRFKLSNVFTIGNLPAAQQDGYTHARMKRAEGVKWVPMGKLVCARRVKEVSARTRRGHTQMVTKASALKDGGVDLTRVAVRRVARPRHLQKQPVFEMGRTHCMLLSLPGDTRRAAARLEVMALNPLQLNVLKAVHGASLVQDVAPGPTSLTKKLTLTPEGEAALGVRCVVQRSKNPAHVRGAFGCAMSHRNALLQAQAHSDAFFVGIFEDDVYNALPLQEISDVLHGCVNMASYAGPPGRCAQGAPSTDKRRAGFLRGPPGSLCAGGAQHRIRPHEMFVWQRCISGAATCDGDNPWLPGPLR